jgi:hypothetical protein
MYVKSRSVCMYVSMCVAYLDASDQCFAIAFFVTCSRHNHRCLTNNLSRAAHDLEKECVLVSTQFCCVCVYVCIRVCVVCMCVCVCVCMVALIVYMYLCAHTCTHIHIQTCTHIHIHARKDLVHTMWAQRYGIPT